MPHGRARILGYVVLLGPNLQIMSHIRVGVCGGRGWSLCSLSVQCVMWLADKDTAQMMRRIRLEIPDLHEFEVEGRNNTGKTKNTKYKKMTSEAFEAIHKLIP